MNHPQDLYHAAVAGEDVKAFLLDWHRRNTDELQAIRIEEDDDVTEVMPIIRRIPASASWDTEKMAAHIICPPKNTLSRAWFSIDGLGRQCLKISDVGALTGDLVEQAVERFYQKTKRYPTQIIPCPSRYPGCIRTGNYYVGKRIRIPYMNEFGTIIDYDILCRGGKDHG